MPPTRYSDQEIYDTLIKFKALFIEHFRIKGIAGLCQLNNVLFHAHHISAAEYGVIQYALNLNKRLYYIDIESSGLYPLSAKIPSAYYFERYDFYPRLGYLHELIEKYKPL